MNSYHFQKNFIHLIALLEVTVLLEYLDLDLKVTEAPCKIYYWNNGITVPGCWIAATLLLLLLRCPVSSSVQRRFKIYTVIRSFTVCMHACVNKIAIVPVSHNLWAIWGTNKIRPGEKCPSCPSLFPSSPSMALNRSSPFCCHFATEDFIKSFGPRNLKLKDTVPVILFFLRLGATRMKEDKCI